MSIIICVCGFVFAFYLPFICFYVYLYTLACKMPFMGFVWAFCMSLFHVDHLRHIAAIADTEAHPRKAQPYTRSAHQTGRTRTAHQTGRSSSAKNPRKRHAKKSPTHGAYFRFFACSMYIFFNVQKHARRNRTHSPHRANHPRKKGSI